MQESDLERIIQILRSHQLKVTPARLEVLRIILNSKEALSFPMLEKMLPHLDRTTIFRTLSTFLKKSLLHTVPDTEGKLKYAYSNRINTCQEHIHFTCLNCHNTCCLPNSHIPFIQLPDGFQYSYANLLVHGFCDTCSQERAATSASYE
ncbi:MAG: transcriptional repressor [Bacteroidia bacterium]|nr:transcriptional repressor [Bacteroidia bacterium]MDW8157914.1 transcriptional repressor [Bacteroidia bacterium]